MFLLIDGSTSKSTCTNIDEKMQQSNAIDLRVDRMFYINKESTFRLSENDKQMRNVDEIFPDHLGNFIITPNCNYQVEFDNWVEIADGEIGWVVPRSSLNRNGITLVSGIYDSGFKNNIGCVLYNHSGHATIAKGTRIGQFILTMAETRYLYNGQYQGE